MAEPPGDPEQIADLLGAYCNRLDRGDVEGWLALFTQDASFLVYGRSFDGHEGLRTMATNAPAGLHLPGPPVVSVDGDEAAVQQSFLFVDQATKDLRIGFYDDVVVRDGQRWLIRTRRVTFLTPGGPSDRP